MILVLFSCKNQFGKQLFLTSVSNDLCVYIPLASPAIPVNDIRGVDAYGHTKAEKILRCKLAACYRLVDLFGWTHGIYNHISVSSFKE